MTISAEAFMESLDRRVAGIVDACTRCGKCAEVCPTPALAGIGGADPKDLTAGVIDILKGAPHAGAAETWARACCGSAFCIDACPEGINPRFMLAMARRALNERRPGAEAKADGRTAFQAMSRGVRMLSKMQLRADVLARLNPPANRSKDGPRAETPPDLIFYTGCNLLKTPHIGLLCLDVMDKLGIRYEVQGGPSNCCGILQFRPGDTPNAARQAITTIERFQATGAAKVLAWCPTCQIQFGEVAMPSMPEATFDLGIFPVYLASRLDELRPMMTTPVRKKVALHEFPGAKGVTEAVVALLTAIPGLEYVDLRRPRVGYALSSLDLLGDYRKDSIAGTFRAAEEAGVTALAGIFHSDHRELSSHQSEWPFEIVNYMDLIGESMGIRRDDVFKRLKLMRDADAVVAASAESIAEHGLDLEDARDAVLKYMLEDQYLPVDRSLHPAE